MNRYYSYLCWKTCNHRQVEDNNTEGLPELLKPPKISITEQTFEWWSISVIKQIMVMLIKAIGCSLSR